MAKISYRKGIATVLAPMIALLCSALPMSGDAVAQPRSYSVAEVTVDATADSAEAARQIALDEGQRKALRELMRRLTLPEDHSRLPEVGSGVVTESVRSFQVVEEQVTPRGYRAEMIVDFDGPAVRRILGGSGLAFVEQVPGAVLVLPVWDGAGGVRLWEEPNPWFAAWSSRPVPDGLVPFRVPLGDLGDIVAIDAERALSLDDESLRAIGERYGTADVLVAVARSDRPAAGSGPARVSVDLRPTGGLALIGDLSLPEVGGETLDAALARGVDLVVRDLRDEWKRTALLIGSEESVLVADAEISGLDDYLALRANLSDVALVRGVTVEALSASTARLAIAHLGSTDLLAGALARRDLELNRFGGVHFLRRGRPAAEGERDALTPSTIDSPRLAPSDPDPPAAVLE